MQEKNNMKARTYTYEEIRVGQSASFAKTWSKEEVDAFALLSGDENPLHTDEAFAKETPFGKPVVHGMLAASSFSALLGMHLPGTHCLYLKQDIVFKKPIFAGDELTVQGVVTRKIEGTRMLEMDMSISKGGEIAVEGIALVQVQHHA